MLNLFLAAFWILTVLGSPGVADFGNCLIAATGSSHETLKNKQTGRLLANKNRFKQNFQYEAKSLNLYQVMGLR